MKKLKFMLAAATAIGLASATQAAVDTYASTGFEKLPLGTNVTTGVKDNDTSFGMDAKGAVDCVKVPGPVLPHKTHWSPWEHLESSQRFPCSQDKVLKQEMARVNVDILGISELKWTGMGEFNSDDHCIYYCGQESLRRNGVVIMVNKRVQNAYLDAISKMTE